MDNANVTILTDGNGVLREYREVKRKANAGERIKIVSAACTGGLYQNNDILTVTKVHDPGHVCADTADGRNAGVFYREYTVLEPTDTVIIDGVRYREERRKARVGERVLIVKAYGTTPFKQKDLGRVVTVTEEDGDTCDGMIKPHCVVGDKALYHDQYVVLTPIDAPQAPTAVAPQVINVNLTITVQPGTDVIQAVADAVKRELTKTSAQEFVSHAEELLGLTKSPQQPAAQCLRDKIVGRAKSDVAGLLNRNYPGLSPSVWLTNKNGTIVTDKVEFVVNREKRTVVALVKTIGSGNVIHRGIAKCAPDDCFNVHIGKAIALRRALGLTVPDEYLNAPQPTEVRVGDVVEYRGFKFSIVSPDSGKHGWSVRRAALNSPVAICSHIIDDSRDQTEVSA